MNVDNTVQLVSCSVQWQCQRSCQAGWLHSWCTAGEMRHVWPWQSTWLSHRYTADSSWQHRPWLPSTQLTASPTVQSHVTSYSMQRTASANRRRQVFSDYGQFLSHCVCASAWVTRVFGASFKLRFCVVCRCFCNSGLCSLLRALVTDCSGTFAVRIVVCVSSFCRSSPPLMGVASPIAWLDFGPTPSCTRRRSSAL